MPKKKFDKLLHWWRYRFATKFIIENSHGEFFCCDLGCGLNADFLNKIEKHIAGAIGLDIKVDNEYQSNKIKLLETDLNHDLPIQNNFADIVTSTAVIEHLNDYKKYVSEIYRITKNGGSAILTTPTSAAEPILKILCLLGLIEKEEIEDHKQYFDKNKLIDTFKEAGFKKVKIRKFQLIFNYLIVAEK